MARDDVSSEKGGMTRSRYIKLSILLFFLLILVFFFWGRGMRFFLVPSKSMDPTLLSRDYLITLRDKEYHRGDIIVLKDPMEKGAYLVKRIVAMGGDAVAVQGGALLLNGVYASEPYIREPMAFELGTITVPSGEVFVMGDNRNHSDDSATWKKAVPADTIIGRVRYIYHPFNRMGPVESFPLTAAAAAE